MELVGSILLFMFILAGIVLSIWLPKVQNKLIDKKQCYDLDAIQGKMHLLVTLRGEYNTIAQFATHHRNSKHNQKGNAL